MHRRPMRLRTSRGTTEGTSWGAQWPERQQGIVEGMADVIRNPVLKKMTSRGDASISVHASIQEGIDQ